jgi:hypothetical protein
MISLYAKKKGDIQSRYGTKGMKMTSTEIR